MTSPTSTTQRTAVELVDALHRPGLPSRAGRTSAPLRSRSSALAELDGGQRVVVLLAAEVADLLHEDQVLRDVADCSFAEIIRCRERLASFAIPFIDELSKTASGESRRRSLPR